MDGHYFVSYSRNDSPDLPQGLADRLRAEKPGYHLWVDIRELKPWQEDWDDQIAYAIQTCRGLLYLMTPDSVRPNSVCKLEWSWALKYKKPIIPVCLHPEAALPFRLQARQYIDFTSGYETGLAQLRLFLADIDSPVGALRELRFRLADAERELPRAREETERARIRQDLADLRAQVVAQERVVANPAAAAAATEQRIATGLEVQREPERPTPQRAARAKFVNQPPMTAPTYFQDRHVETELLADFLRAQDTRLATVIGRGGVGKTAMVCRLLKGLEYGRLPDNLDATHGPIEIAGIVYLRTPSAHPVSWSNLFTDLCRLLPEDTAEPLLRRYQGPHESPAVLMSALLEAFPTGCSVVLLDNFEDLIDPDTGAITDTALDEALRALLSAPAHGVKIVITTRVGPQPLQLHQPGVQQRIDLDEGLPSPYAEQLLRARDPDGKLGLKSAAPEQLAQARERTRGYPRALEALAAILSADRNTTLSELLDQTTRLPDNVVIALVGEAFLRLDPVAQQVMQALAIYPIPVPAVAIDYLLQPYQPAINSAPILARLVNMQFVRRDAGHFYLHQVDRDYAVSRIPDGHATDRDPDLPPPFSRIALRHRGAEYFTQTQTPREDWKTLDDLAPQLAEFELRCQAGDYDTAAETLLAIDFDYLIPWGHYRHAIALHSRLDGHITDSQNRSASLNNLGICYLALGDSSRAIQLHEQILVIARETGDRDIESAALIGLGNCYSELGQLPRAVQLYEQALTLARETGNRRGEANSLGNLGNCRDTLGQIQQAIQLYAQTLTIMREIGERQSEAAVLCNIGMCHADLGETRHAVELHEQALTIAQEIGYREVEAVALDNVGLCHAELGQWKSAIEHISRAIEIADAVGNAQAQGDGRRDLARTQLWVGDLAAARRTIDATRDHLYPPARAEIALLDGIVALHEGAPARAARALHSAIGHADQRLAHNPDDYAALDTKALALTALTLAGDGATDDADAVARVLTVFRAARTLTGAPGITARIGRYLDTLSPDGPHAIPQDIRLAATGSAP